TGVIWAGMSATLALMIAVAVVFRVDVVRLWPGSAAAFASVGLPVNSVGLTIEGVEFEPALQDGHAALSISGMIRNVEDRTITAPPLQIRLLDKADPPGTAADLEITFAQVRVAAAPKAPPKPESLDLRGAAEASLLDHPAVAVKEAEPLPPEPHQQDHHEGEGHE
ncbi:MAG TPA: hypothetical protein PKA17_01725, partial [Phenylobacterium sp.]|nr:hypothetical protein [Phenylobacterium sp.]